MKLWYTFAALLLATLPLTAVESGPAATIQTAPCGKILTEIREAANLVAGETGRKAIDDMLKSKLGEKGFLGLDLTRPLLGYLIFNEKDAEKFSVVLLVPINKQEDFLDLLTRCGLEPELTKDSKDIYKLGAFDIPEQDKPMNFEVTMRFAERLAYIGFNVAADQFDPAKLFKPEQINDPKETALFSFRQFNDRVPEGVLTANFKQWGTMLDKLKKDSGAGDDGKPAFEAIDKIVKALGAMSVQSKETGTRILLDTTTGDFSIDSYYTPRAGTDLAKAVAARKPTENTFAGLIDNTSAAAGVMQLPVGFKEMQDLMVTGIEALQKMAKEDAPPPFAKDLVDEGLAGLLRTVKSGTWDIGATINGPDKDGHFSAVIASTFENAIPIEKAIKANLKDFPAEIRNCITVDVDKVGEINIHTIDPPADEGLGKVFGDRKIYVAFGPKGVYVTFGNEAKELIKKAINAKPKVANAFDIQLNPKRLGKVFSLVEPQAADKIEKIMGNEDKLLSAYSFTISGGDALRIKFGMNLKVLPKLMFGAFDAN